MRAGTLRHRVVIQSRTHSRDSLGTASPSWSTVTTVWAAVSPVDAGEMIESGQVQGEVTHAVTIRATDISPENRLLFGSRVLEIVKVLNKDERGIQVDLLCKERL